MDHVADEDRVVAARAGVDDDVAGSMAGGALEPDAVLHRVVVVDQYRLPGRYDRQYAVLEGQAMRRILATPCERLPVIELAARHDVAGVRKGRDPAAVVEPGVPADMVPMEMRAHHVIDRFGRHPGGGEIGEIGALHTVELRPGRPLLVVAEAGIDQDRVTPGLDDEGVKAEHQPARRRVDQPRPGQIGVGAQDLGIEIRQKILGRDERPLILSNAMHFEITDPRLLHFRLLRDLPLRAAYAAAQPRSHPARVVDPRDYEIFHDPSGCRQLLNM